MRHHYRIGLNPTFGQNYTQGVFGGQGFVTTGGLRPYELHMPHRPEADPTLRPHDEPGRHAQRDNYGGHDRWQHRGPVQEMRRPGGYGYGDQAHVDLDRDRGEWQQQGPSQHDRWQHEQQQRQWGPPPGYAQDERWQGEGRRMNRDDHDERWYTGPHPRQWGPQQDRGYDERWQHEPRERRWGQDERFNNYDDDPRRWAGPDHADDDAWDHAVPPGDERWVHGYGPRRHRR